MKKRIYKNKNYWIRKAGKESAKLPSERLNELIKYECWETIEKEIPILKEILDKLSIPISNCVAGEDIRPDDLVYLNRKNGKVYRV